MVTTDLITTEDRNHKYSLDYRLPKGKSLPHMPDNTYFSIGYNNKYGLVDVVESNGDPYFEGRINIQNLLARLQFVERKEINSQVENHIMEAYTNLWDYLKNPKKHSNPPTPILEVLILKGNLER